MNYFISQFKRQSGIDITNDKRAVQRLRKQCENAKRTLSNQNSATVECDALAEGKDFSSTISRAKFEELNVDLFKKTLVPVTQVLKDANMAKGKVDQIILVGGSTRIPKIQSMLSEYFGGKELNKSINPDEAVVSYTDSLSGIVINERENVCVLCATVYQKNIDLYTLVFLFGSYNKYRLMGQPFKEVYSVVMRPMPPRTYYC